MTKFNTIISISLTLAVLFLFRGCAALKSKPYQKICTQDFDNFIIFSDPPLVVDEIINIFSDRLPQMSYSLLKGRHEKNMWLKNVDTNEYRLCTVLFYNADGCTSWAYWDFQYENEEWNNVNSVVKMIMCP